PRSSRRVPRTQGVRPHRPHRRMRGNLRPHRRRRTAGVVTPVTSARTAAVQPGGSRASTLNPIDLPPAAVDNVVIISHVPPQGLVGHELLLHSEEIIDRLDFRLGDNGPEGLARDVAEQAKGFMSHSFHSCRDASELLELLTDLSGLAVQDLADYVHDVLLS